MRSKEDVKNLLEASANEVYEKHVGAPKRQ